ncbi:MAG: DUF3089 domain-containing protein [Ferruginibacter sp.]
MKIYYPAFILALVLLTASCSKKNFANKPEYQFKSPDGKPDYSDLNYWAAHPWKWDPSDSVPKPLRKNYTKDSTVDVFFIYPTTLSDAKDGRWNAPIDDAVLNAKTDYSTILYQASAFNEQCRIFAPRYRQANLKSFYTGEKTTATKAFELAYADVKAAFEYYLQHYNNGRPIIIAAHSQGTIHAGRLLKEFFEGKPLYNKLVCAYVIGMPTPENYFTSIPSCKDSLATGCFVGWRSFHKDYTADYIAKENFKSLVTNPLLWTSDTTYAPAALNKGGVLINFNKVTTKVVDAQIHNNVLWTSKPKFFGNVFLTKKNYHIADINMFYINIAKNVKTRIKMFWKK